MRTTDTSEKGLETIIMRHMTGTDGLAPLREGGVAELSVAFNAEWRAGNAKDYDRAYALDVPQLFEFLQATQPDTFKKIGMADDKDAKDISLDKYFN